VLQELSPGDDLGPYRIVAPLESGGMASLYLAHRPPDREIVAVKVIRTALREVSSIIRMFQDEVRTLTHIHHRNVVRVLDAGESDAGRFLAMEYLHGCSLARIVDELRRLERDVPVDVAIYVAAEVATALHAAHEAVDDMGRPLSIVHRDVSPQNVMISESARVKLIDFGVAKAHGRLEVTNAKMVKGKLRYMAPEQAGGESVDRRTDVFALGVVLWEVLTGRDFAGREQGLDLFTRLLNPAPTPPSDDNSEVPPELDDVVLAMMARDALDRPASGLAVADRLRALLDDPEAARERLRLIVNEMFGIELAYTRAWITEKFSMPDEDGPDEDDDDTVAASRPRTETVTVNMDMNVLAAMAANRVKRDELALVESASWQPQELETAPGRPAVKGPPRRLDLTFSLARSAGPDATGARPLARPFEGPSHLPDGPDGAAFDHDDSTDKLAIKCLTNLRRANWLPRPAGVPPSLSIIEPLESLEALSERPPSTPPTKTPSTIPPPARKWGVFVAVALVVAIAVVVASYVLVPT